MIIQDIIDSLAKLEKAAYENVIDITLKQFTSKKVCMDILQKFYITRLNRETSMYDAIQNKYKNEDIVESYSTFRTILSKITGKNDDLDDRNGVINQSVYGEANKQTERKRIIAELNIRGADFTQKVIDRFSKYRDKIEDLKNKLT